MFRWYRRKQEQKRQEKEQLEKEREERRQLLLKQKYEERLRVWEKEKNEQLDRRDYQVLDGCPLSRGILASWWIGEKDLVLVLFKPFQTDLVHSNRLEATFNPEKNYFFIDDMSVRHRNQGDGSIILQGLIRLAKMKGVDKIVGTLSPVDADRFPQLERFYTKNGFSVRFQSKTYGRIVWTNKSGISER